MNHGVNVTIKQLKQHLDSFATCLIELFDDIIYCFCLQYCLYNSVRNIGVSCQKRFH